MKRPYLLPTVLIVVLSIVLIGCGGGGGGGENPVAATGESRLVSLTGRVLLANVPQAGVSVYLYRADEAEIAGLADQYTARASVRGAMLPDSSADERATLTDAAGVYRFDGVPEGEYTLMAQKSATERAALTKIVLSSVAGAVTTKDASLQPTSDITGTISVNGISGLSGGRVYLLGTSFVSITDASGNFRISYVPTGTSFQLMAEFGGAVLAEPIAIEAVAGTTTGSPALPLPLILSKPPAVATGGIVGTATRQMFAPGDENSHSGTLVYLMQNGLFLTMTETTPAGAYGFFNLPVSPNNVYQVRFASPNYTPTPAVVDVVVAANADTAATPVTLTPKIQTAVLGRLRGRVQKQSFLGLEQESNAVMLRLATGTTFADRLEFNVKSDEQGIFLFTGIPIGTYTLTCADPDYVFAGGPFALAVLAPINDLSAASPFQLVPAAMARRLGGLTGRVVRIRFVDAEEKTELIPLRIATGTPGTAGFLEKITMADADGFFAFTGIPIGAYPLRCGDADYIFSTGNAVATVVAALPAQDNGRFDLVPNPAAGGTGGFLATLSTAIADPIRVAFVSQLSAANNREGYTIPRGAGIHNLLMRNLVPGAYVMCLDPATGYDFSPADKPVTITANTIATLPVNLIPVSILPVISSVNQSGNSVTVSGSNLNDEYRIQLSHIGGTPWFEIPTSVSGGALVGNANTVPGGKYNLCVANPPYENLRAASTFIVQIAPAPVATIASTTTVSSIGISWTASPSVKLFEARLALASNPAVPLQVIKTADTVATFVNLIPSTGYSLSVFSVADGLYGTPLTRVVTTATVPAAPVFVSVTGYASMSSILTPTARNGVIYYVTYGANPATLQRLDTINSSSGSVTLPGTIITPSVCLGDYVYVTSYANDGLRAYNYDLSGPVASYKPTFLNLMCTTVSPRDGRLYCFWDDSVVKTATMSVLMPDLSVQSMHAIPAGVNPQSIRCGTNFDGSQVGFHYLSGSYSLYLISPKTNQPSQKMNSAPGVEMLGGYNGSILTVNSDNIGQEYYALETGQGATMSMALPLGYTDFVLDHQLNRWAFNAVGGQINVLVVRSDGRTLRQYSFAGFSFRGACFDPVLKKVYVLYGDPTISVAAFDANL